MSHEIYRDRMIANDGKAVWHESLTGATIREEEQGIADAVSDVLSGPNGPIEFAKEPAATFNPKTGLFELLNNQYNVVMRDPNNEERQLWSYGQVSKDFVMTDPVTVSKTLDEVMKEYPVHTIGMLRNGSTIFVSCYAGRETITGDEYDNYIHFLFSIEPGRTNKAFTSRVRIVCANTESLALSRCELAFDISHTGNVDGKIAFAAELLKSYEERKEFFASMMEAFVKHTITTEEFAAVVEAAYPLPKRPKVLRQTLDQMEPAEMAKFRGGAIEDLLADLTDKERAYVNSVARVDEARKLAFANFVVFNKEHPEKANTAEGAYHTITFTADWRDGNNTGARGNVGESALIGPRFREKVRASELLIDIVGLN